MTHNASPLTSESNRILMRILTVSDQYQLTNALKVLLKQHSEEYWETPVASLQELEQWLERQPNLLMVGLPIDAAGQQLISALQAQLQLAVVLHCKDIDVKLLEAVQTIQPQAILVHPVTEPQLIATLHLIRLSRSVAVEPQLKVLSNREREVLQLVLKGFTSKEIGQQLFVSMNTVNTHKRRIKEKLGVRRWVEVRSKISN
jgi:DNA-binding NarL/FixJ family response regulator